MFYLYQLFQAPLSDQFQVPHFDLFFLSFFLIFSVFLHVFFVYVTHFFFFERTQLFKALESWNFVSFFLHFVHQSFFHEFHLLICLMFLKKKKYVNSSHLQWQKGWKLEMLFFFLVNEVFVVILFSCFFFLFVFSYPFLGSCCFFPLLFSLGGVVARKVKRDRIRNIN